MRFGKWLVVGGVGLFCGLPMSGQADTVVFDNFGPGNAFQEGTGFSETGPSSGFGIISKGDGFIPSSSGTLSSIDIALQYATGTNDAHLFLSDGVPGEVGTNILESFTLTNLPVSTGSNPVFDTLTSTLHPLLTAGQTYYFYEAETGNEFNSWHLNSIGGIGPVISSNDNVNYDVDDNVQAALRVSVTSSVSVPEPSGVALLAAAGSLAGCGWRRRCKAARRAE